MILLNSDVLDETNISVCRKKQASGSGSNFFFSPNIGLKVYNAKVLIVTQKYIVFTFDKRTHLSLLNLFRKINNRLQTIIKHTFYDLKDHPIHSMISENEETFTIRCNLPNYRGKYLVKSYQNNMEIKFNLPNINAVFDCILIDIKNLWQLNDTLAYNVELKTLF